MFFCFGNHFLFKYILAGCAQQTSNMYHKTFFYKFWNKIELETYLEQKSTACLTEYQGKESFSHKIMRNRCSDREIVANLNFDLIPFNLGYIQVPWNWNLKYEK